MKYAHRLAFLNLLFIIFNCGWILILDSTKFFGTNIYETFSKHWSYLTPHRTTFNIWKVITAVLIITAILYCLVLKRGHHRDIPLRDKILVSGNTLIINQTLLGLSMAFKLNDYLFLSYIFSIAVVYTLLLLNKQFELDDYKNSLAIHFFTRISLGLYTGWMIFLLGFNGLSTLSAHGFFYLEDTLYFYISTIYLLGSFGYILYKSCIYLLPSITVGYTIGILGAYYYNLQLSLLENKHILVMRYMLLTIIVISIIISSYLLFVKRQKVSLETTEVLN